MYNIVRITREIPIHPSKLSDRLYEHIHQEVINNVRNCNEEYGYIIEIIQILNIKDNCIRPSDSYIIFNVEYEAKVFKPIVGNVLNGFIIIKFDYGSFVEINNILKVFVKGDNNLNIGDNVDITVLQVKYEQSKYICIGEFV